MSRFAGYPSAEGLMVLDTWTGEVALIRPGRAPEIVRPAVARPGEAPAFTPFPTPQAITDVALPGREPELAPLDREILERFPYPVAIVWRTFLDEPDPRQRVKLLVDAFTALLKLWALEVAADYVASSVRHPIVTQTLERDFQRPLISTWNVFLQRTLPILADAGHALFAPELSAVYEEIEAECVDRVAVRVPYETETGERRHRVSRLGKVSALIRYRNGLAHGFHQSREKAEADLEEWRPVLTDVLARARFVTRYPLYVTTPAGHHRLMGARPDGAAEALPIPPPAAPAFLYDPATERALALPVLLDTDALESGAEACEGLGKDLVLFEGLARRSVVYVAAADGSRLEKQRALDRWRALLADKHVEGRAMGKDRLDAKWLREASRRQVSAALEDLTRHGKYLPDATVERTDLAPVLGRFEHGTYGGLVLAGDGGVGKTTLLARCVARWRDAGDVVVFLRGASIGRPDLGRRVVRELAVADLFFDDFLVAADRLFADGRRLRIVVDGVDEHPEDAAALVRSFDECVEQAADHPWVRLVCSVRTAAYRRIADRAAFSPGERRRYVMGEDGPLIEVGPLPPALVPAAYEKHRELRVVDPELGGEGVFQFRPETSFAELDPTGTTTRLLTNPLMLRLLLAAHHRRPLPSHLGAADAFEVYLEQAVVERDAAGGAHPERRSFLRAFVRHLDGIDADGDVREALYDAPALRPALENPEKDSPYVALLDLGVLREEWEGERCVVRFAFAGLCEHLLAELHEARVEGPEDLFALARRAMTFPSLREALVMLAHRLVQKRRAPVLVEALDRAREQDAGPHELLAQVAIDLVVLLGRYRDEGFAALLARMQAEASITDVRVLLAAFDRLFVVGETEAAEQALGAAGAVDAVLLHAPAEVSLRAARLAHRRGDVDTAAAALADARAHATDARLAAEVALLAAELAVSRGRLDEADAEYRAAQAAFEAIEAFGSASAAVRGLASVAGRRDARDEERRLIEHAAELARRAGDDENLARALNNLGRAHRVAGRPLEAERCYRESMAIKRELGDRVGVASTELNLGSVLFGRGEIEAAERCWRDALALAAAAQHRLIEAFAHLNLAVSGRWRGDPRRALVHAMEALVHFERRDDPRGAAYASYQCASSALDLAALDEGALDDARAHCARLRALAPRVPEAKLEIYDAILAARLATREGSIEDARAALEALAAADARTGARAWDLEEGPFEAYLEGALRLRELGDPTWTEWATAARDTAHGRPHPRAVLLPSP